MSDSPPLPEALVADLIELLGVRRMGDGWYMGPRKKGGVGRVFGGQVVAQALAAAQDTVDPARIAHSLHAYFLRAGNEDYEITFRVERDFDGGSFSNRRIIAMQQDKPIFNMAASFHTLSEGLSHQNRMPDVPPPEDLRNGDDIMREGMAGRPDAARFLERYRPIDYRPVDQANWSRRGKQEALQHIWFRTVAPLPDDPGLHRAILTYASDSYLLGTCCMPHAVSWMSPGFTSASLDHAVWLHDDFRADDWLLYSCDSPWAGRDRGFNRGAIYARDGRLVASCTQEGLIRYRAPINPNV